MKEKYSTYINSPVGWLKISSNHEAILSVSFEETKGISSDKIPDILQKSIRQLNEYFERKRQEFDLILSPEGTEFQKKVWTLVLQIPFGRTASYLDIALLTGSEKNTRAVGLANGKNPIPIIIPCHRIVGSNGKLTGYAGGLERKRWLLLHEQNLSNRKNLLF